MIAYEDLVAALKSWRARNGLPNTPPDYGDAGPVPSYAVSQGGAAPDEIYDLSDDSGLIVAEDLQSRDSEYAGEYDGDAYQGDAYGGYNDDPVGAIETGVEISAEGEAPEAGDYDNPPGTDAYGYASGEYEQPVQPHQYAANPYEGDEVATGAYDEAPAQQYDYQSGGEYGAYGDAPAEGTLEADAEDVVDEMDAESEAALPGVYDDVSDDDAALFAGDESIDEATVVAGGPDQYEPEALPEPPDDEER